MTAAETGEGGGGGRGAVSWGRKAPGAAPGRASCLQRLGLSPWQLKLPRGGEEEYHQASQHFFKLKFMPAKQFGPF